MENFQDTKLDFGKNMFLSAIKTVPATGNHYSTVIFMHGYGEHGSVWADALKNIKPKNAKLILPTAAPLIEKENGGANVTGWYRFQGYSDTHEVDMMGLQESYLILNHFIKAEIESGITPNKICVGGFGQGGSLALFSACKMSQSLAGVFGLSCWIPDRIPKLNTKTPIFIGHGNLDNVVPRCKAAINSIAVSNNLVEYHEYSGLMHTTRQDELNDLQAFLNRILN